MNLRLHLFIELSSPVDTRLFVALSDFFDNTKRRGHSNKYLHIRSQVTGTHRESVIRLFFAPPRRTKRYGILLTTTDWNVENRARAVDNFALNSPQIRLQRARGGAEGGKGEPTTVKYPLPFRPVSSTGRVAYRHDVTCIPAGAKKARSVCVNWKRPRRLSRVFILFRRRTEVDQPWRLAGIVERQDATHLRACLLIFADSRIRRSKTKTGIN